MRIVAVVLAAGEGRRMGGPKALLRLDRETFLERVCTELARPAVCSVVVVLGAEAERVRREARIPEGVVVVVNDAWRDGMLSSVWRGLDAAEARGAEALLLHPVDHPFVEPQTVDAVCAELQAGAALAVPEFAGRRGHPGGFSGALFHELRAADPARGARAVLERNLSRVVLVPAGPGCRRGVNTPEDLRGD